MRHDPIAHLCKQVTLFVNRQQDVKSLGRETVEHKRQKVLRIGPEPRTAVVPAHKAGKAANTMRIGIAYLDMVACEAQGGDGLTRRSA
ncbi:MAG: hypothetical protein ACRECO_07090 [Xanthobacteraceae bacterium]